MSSTTTPNQYELNLNDAFWPKQHEANRVADTHKFTLFGGAKGPGKSRWLRWYEARYVLLAWLNGIYNVQVGIFCESYPALKDRQIGKIEIEFPEWLGSLQETKARGLGFHFKPEYGNGSILLRNLDDPIKYRSLELASIAVDELTQNRLETFNLLRPCLRWPGIPDSRCTFVAGSNPDGIGHLWVKQYFIDRDLPKELERYADQFAFVPALPDDNPALDQTYWDMLESLPYDLAQAWRWGNWDIFEGQAFDRFKRDVHVCDPFEIPKHWSRWRSVDWGFRAPFCCLWLAKDPDTGRIFVYRELYEDSLTDRQQARKILDNTPPDEQINITYADPSMWVRKNMENVVYSSADEYTAEGVPLTKGINARISNKRKVDTLMERLPDGRPGLIFLSTCRNLIRTFPALSRDPHNPEDVDPESEDHAYAALCYGLTRVNPRPVVIDPAQATLQAAWEARKHDPIARKVVENALALSGKDFR